MGTNPSEDNTWYCRSRSFEDFFTWLKCKELNWLDGYIMLMYVKWALFCIFLYFFFTRHVSDKDRQSKLYRNVQPVFSIDDEDEDGGIDLTVWCNWFQSECMKRSCRRITANWDSISLSHNRWCLPLKEATNKKELSCQYSSKEPQ